MLALRLHPLHLDAHTGAVLAFLVLSLVFVASCMVTVDVSRDLCAHILRALDSSGLH